jgi:membrane associated rhomboid family serine protease
MLTFYFFAFRLEAAFGYFNFIVIYFGSMIAGGIYTVFKKKDDYGYGSVGASGAISGVLFSFILFAPTSGMMIFPIPFPLPAWIFGLLYLTWTYFAAQKSFDRINHDAHFYGAIAGVILTIILVPGILGHFINSF